MRLGGTSPNPAAHILRKHTHACDALSDRSIHRVPISERHARVASPALSAASIGRPRGHGPPDRRWASRVASRNRCPPQVRIFLASPSSPPPHPYSTRPLPPPLSSSIGRLRRTANPPILSIDHGAADLILAVPRRSLCLGAALSPSLSLM